MTLQKKFSSQQEELQVKTGEYHKIYGKYKQSTSEKQDIENEIHRERENLMGRIRELTKEIRLKHLIIDNFIPATEYMKIERTAEWRDDIKEWYIPNLEYTGTNIKINKAKKKKGEKIDGEIAGNFLYEHILNFDDEEEEEDYKSAATDRVQSMISNIMMEEGEEVVPPITAQPSVYYKYTDVGAEREDPEALTKKKPKKAARPGTSKRPMTAKKGDIVSMVETMTNVQNVEKQEAEARK